jgi:hypothetical protein
MTGQVKSLDQARGLVERSSLRTHGKRERITSALAFSWLLGLALLQFSWLFCPWLGYFVALSNLVFILALCVAWLISRLGGNR